MKPLATSNQRSAKSRGVLWLAAGCWLLAAALVGCEALQRKLTRKPRQPAPPPKPIVVFQDYTRAMTPLDRYRKHYMLFDYWNDDLMHSLQGGSFNAKRLTRSSAESLGELKTMQDLLAEEFAHQLQPLIEERTKLDGQLRTPTFGEGQANTIRRVLETQSRQIHRDFFWRDVEDRLDAQPH